MVARQGPKSCAALLVFPLAAALALAGCGPDTAPVEAPPELDAARAASDVAGTPRGARVVGTVPIAENGVPSFIALLPLTARAFAPPEHTPAMDQVALTFSPSILMARTNEPVQFWNSDDVLHNVRVYDAVTRAPSFNVAIPTGSKYEYTFTKDGFYEVGCDIHPGMSAVVFATSTPYAARADKDGRFEFPDVVPGPYTAAIYAGARAIERVVDVTEPTTELTID